MSNVDDFDYYKTVKNLVAQVEQIAMLRQYLIHNKMNKQKQKSGKYVFEFTVYIEIIKISVLYCLKQELTLLFILVLIKEEYNII